MQVVSRPDPERQIRRNFDALKPYPFGNGYTWQQFLESQEGKKGLFMLVVERELGHLEIAFSPHREKLFGLYSDRPDGKLGRNCFGWATPDFGGEKKPYEDIFQVDGYDPKFLHAYDFSSAEGHPMVNAPYRQYKVVRVVDSEEEIAEEIAKLARRFISADVPTREGAVVLASIVHIFRTILREQEHPLIQSVAKEVMAKIGERWSTLEEENDDLRGRIKENENEMDVLNGFAPERE